MATTVSPPHGQLGVDERSSGVGLRTVAGFEALKGSAVLLLGVVLFFVHSEAEDLAGRFLFAVHIDPDRRLARMLMGAASKVSDARVWTIVAAAITYSTVRFVEAWGLWNRRVWAEWFALLSGAMYLPWEILRMMERLDWDRIAVFGINLIIVLYMLEIRLRACGAIFRCEKPSENSQNEPSEISRTF